MWKVVIAPTAQKSLESVLNKNLKLGIARGLYRLSRNPEESGRLLLGPLAGLRATYLEGDWCRIVFRTVDSEIQIVSITFNSAEKKNQKDLLDLARGLFRMRLL